MQEKLNEYLALCELPYEEAIDVLNLKYGTVTDNYFKEDSYEEFLRGTIKAPRRGGYSRNSEGLYCHHVHEDRYINLSNPADCKAQKVAFVHQRKKNLVYCDFFEHLILHAIISSSLDREKKRFGYGGYEMMFQWALERYYTGDIPKAQNRTYYDRAIIDKETLKVLLYKLNDMLGSFGFFNIRDEVAENQIKSPYYELLPENLKNELQDYKRKKDNNELRLRPKDADEKVHAVYSSRLEEEYKTRRENQRKDECKRLAGELKNLRLDKTVPRRDIVYYLFTLKNIEVQKITFEQYIKETNVYVRKELIAKLEKCLNDFKV